MDELRTHYRLTADNIATRAKAALRDLEKAQIGTVHSFAAHLLRLFLWRRRVDPAFREDDGLRFDTNPFSSHGMSGSIASSVAKVPIIPDGEHSCIPRPWSSCGYSPMRCAMISSISTCCSVRSYQDRTRPSRTGSLACMTGLRRFGLQRPTEAAQDRAHAGRSRCSPHARERQRARIHRRTRSFRTAMARKGSGPGNQRLEHHEFSQAVGVVKIAKQILAFNVSYFINLLIIISPLVTSIRSSFARSGWISFDGLLARASRFLWEHPDVRERIKREYRAILIDEFQDTDLSNTKYSWLSPKHRGVHPWPGKTWCSNQESCSSSAIPAVN